MANEPRFVECKWKDAFADGVDDATPENAIFGHKPIIMHTRGWLLVDDEVGVSLFYERCENPLSYRGRTFVPRELVLNIEDFPVKRKPRAKVKPAPASAD